MTRSTILRVIVLSVLGLFVILCVLLIQNGGTFNLYQYIRERQKPKLEPVQSGVSQSGVVFVAFTANTNCIMVGETLTLTVELANNTSGPLTLTATPPLDIVITPRVGFDAEDRPSPLSWSTTPSYPTTIDPHLQPGERRNYQWNWTVPPDYRTPLGGDIAIDLLITSQEVGQSPRAGRVHLYLGIGSVSIGQGRFPCTEMRR